MAIVSQNRLRFFANVGQLGLYMKIPRRTLFAAQLIACILGSLTQSKFETVRYHITADSGPDGVLIWMLGHIEGICDDDQPHGYTCPQGRVNFTSSIIWGGRLNQYLHSLEMDQLTFVNAAIGPSRLYSIGKQYSGLLHFFWIGALLPIVTFYLKKYFPKNSFLKSIHWPLFFAGTGNLPPAVSIPFISSLGCINTILFSDRHQLHDGFCRQPHIQQNHQVSVQTLVLVPSIFLMQSFYANKTLTRFVQRGQV